VLTKKPSQGFAGAECYQTSLTFPRAFCRRVEVNFSGGEISSNGVLLQRQARERISLTQAVAKVVELHARWPHLYWKIDPPTHS